MQNGNFIGIQQTRDTSTAYSTKKYMRAFNVLLSILFEIFDYIFRIFENNIFSEFFINFYLMKNTNFQKF